MVALEGSFLIIWQIFDIIEKKKKKKTRPTLEKDYLYLINGRTNRVARQALNAFDFSLNFQPARFLRSAKNKHEESYSH